MALAELGSHLDLALEARLEQAAADLTSWVAASVDPAPRAKGLALAAFAAAISADHDRARSFADAAADAARASDDRAATAIAEPVSSFIACLADPAGLVLGTSPAARLDDLAEPDGCIAGYIAIEAAMSAGRLRDAEVLAIDYLARRWTSSTQAPVFAAIALARSLIFQGRVADAVVAGDAAAALAEASGGVPARMLASATQAYTAAQNEDRALAERLTTRVIDLEPNPSSYVTVGSHVLCAYALGAVGNAERAGRMLLHAGGGPSLPGLQTVDRAYAYELLATAAIDAHDLTAARAWGRRAAPLAIHDMAAAAVERTLSRIDTATGHSVSGAERAAISAARALVAGGRLDAARSRVLHASALAATGERGAAVAEFRDAANDAASLGAVAVRNWSARELRRLGRRLRPATGSGWTSLSLREQEIALLAAEGYTNRMIGQALFLSGRTVQSHLSRALAALGVASRAALPASLGRAPADDTTLEGLTERQREVARLVAQGSSNREISLRLGISDKTVEKHVQAIFARWHLSSRTGIANRVLAPLPVTEGQSA